MQYKSLMASSRMVSKAPDLRLTTILSASIIRLCTCTGGARPPVARAHGPVCPSLAMPLKRSDLEQSYGGCIGFSTKVRLFGW